MEYPGNNGHSETATVQRSNGVPANTLPPEPDNPTDSIRNLLRYLGDDPNREGLQDTPGRYLRMMKEITTPEPFTFTTFDSEGYKEMIVETAIPFYSLCEHHLLPFFGTAVVGYIPKGKIAGLSKLARAVQYHAAGLQNQERITNDVLAMIEDNLHPKGVGVILQARHFCMEMRGVKAPGTLTTTSALSGVFRKARTRAEFLSLAFIDQK